MALEARVMIAVDEAGLRVPTLVPSTTVRCSAPPGS
jgi:hypothetical protein